MMLYIALLRGINVGANSLAMERVRGVFSGLGLRNVRTYLQSGNVLFESKTTAASLCKTIEQGLAGATRLPVSVIIRTQGQWRDIIDGNLFLDDPAVDASKLHVTFLAERRAARQFESLAEVASGADRHVVAGSHVYLYCPGGYGRTKLSTTRLEKMLATRATTRNWSTVKALYELSLK